MDDANLDSALNALASLSPYAELGVVQYFRDPDQQIDDTGIVFTVAELREILEAARVQAWRDAETDPPDDGQEVLVEDYEYDRRELVACYVASGAKWIDGEGFYIGAVRRWRELPR